MARLIGAAMIAICAWQVRASTDCTPSCLGLEEGSRIQDPEDCRSYFVCLEDELPSDSSITCPTGQYFDSTSGSCSESKPETCRPCSHCRTRCSDAINDLLSNPMDCSSFFVCLLGSPIKTNCDANEYFDGTSCTSDPDSCCNPCLAYCPQGGIEAYDPYDCTMYYLCEEEGVPDETHHKQCPPENPVYDRDLYRCGQGDVNCMDESNSSSINPCPTSLDAEISWSY